MLHFLHDGTPEGIFTCVYEALKSIKKPDHLYDANRIQQSILDEYVYTGCDYAKSEFIYKLAERRISALAQHMICTMALSHEIDAATGILNYITEGLKYGRMIEYAYANDAVLKAWDLRKNVLSEYHKYLGFLRFNRLRCGIFFAEYAPKNNLNSLIAEHFCDRMKNERWVINDKNRGKAVVYNGEIYKEVDFEGFEMDFDNEGFETLWKKFLETVTIRERINFKLQSGNMPKRYRRFMTENPWRG